MSLNMVTLILDVADGAGSPADRGSASLAPSVQLTDTADNLLVVAPVRAVFTADGFPQVRLIATDSTGPQPPGWAWTVTFHGIPGSPAGFSFFLPYANGAVQYLSSLAPVSPVAAMAGYLPLAGGTMTGPVTFAGTVTIPASAGAGKVLTSDSGGAASWQALAAALSFSQPFTAASLVTVTHNLGKHPAVSVADSAGDEVDGDVQYLSANQLTVSFSAPFSGTVYCN